MRINKGFMIILMVAALGLSGCCGDNSMHVKVGSLDKVHFGQMVNNAVTDLMGNFLS